MENLNWAAIALFIMCGGLFLCIIDRDKKIKHLRDEIEQLKRRNMVESYTKK